MIDFFYVNCQMSGILATRFGLCDDQNGRAAYVDFHNDQIWIATVINNSGSAVTFTAIDKCVLNDEQFIGRGRCDCMLTTETHLHLIELKEKDPPWISHSLEQLESTIQFLFDNHDLSQFKVRKIHACNKRSERFFVFDNDENTEFLRRTTFRRDVQSTVVIV